MRNRKLVVLLVAAALAVGVQNYVFFSSLADRPDPVRGELDAALEEAEDPADAPLAPVDPHALASWLSSQPGPARSPFLTRDEARRLGESRSPLLPRLTGTLWSPGRRVAWLDGSPWSEGDWVGLHRIARIDRDRVLLERGDAEIALALEPGMATEGEGDDGR